MYFNMQNILILIVVKIYTLALPLFLSSNFICDKYLGPNAGA